MTVESFPLLNVAKKGTISGIAKRHAPLPRGVPSLQHLSLLSAAILQVRALSDALKESHVRNNELEDQVRRNVLLETTAGSELRRLTDENEHLVNRMTKLEDDLKYVVSRRRCI
jgi:hypothetical protein